MSFIERALEQLKQEAPAGKAELRDPIQQPPVQSVEHIADKSGQKGRTADTIRAMPCRSDAMVRVDYSALRAEGLTAPEDEEGRVAEEYRVIKQPLLKSLTADDAPRLCNVLVVTSAVPGEGKTFTSVNLALSLARERNREVLLIDGDVIKRHITRHFGLDEFAGLLDAAGAEGPGLEQTILKTSVPSLYVLPAGNRQADATEILRSDRVAALLGSLASERRRIILVDSPPLLATSEAGVLASLAGQVVVVVKASETAQDVVVRAIESIPEDKPVSLILNQLLSMPERHYGYDDYYGRYGYGRKHGTDGDDPKGRDASQG